MTLYDIQGEYLALYDLATAEDDEQAFLDTLECLHGELAVKGEGYAKVIKQLEMEADECDKVIEAFTRKRELRKNHVKKMKEAYLEAMGIAGLDEIQAGAYKIKVKGNGGKAPLIITGDVPDNFMKIKYEPDNELIRKAIESGDDVGFAHLAPRGKHIEIK